MRILYLAMEYDYGDPQRGRSFEDVTFFDSLQKMGHDIIRFDYVALMQQHGREEMNRRLKELAFDERFDLLFCVLFKEEIDRSIMKQITEHAGFQTLNWFCDDHWRFNNFSKYWAPCFSWVTTTDIQAVSKYKEMGYNNVILTQWAGNNFSYKKLNLPMKYDVTFVGQPHGNRRKIIEKLGRRGVRVDAWGFGWENGRLDQEAMIRVFNQSRINLNLSNSSTSWRQLWRQRPDQIKGRNFEIPICGGFELTSFVTGIERYYIPEEEIVLFKTFEELCVKIEYFLDHEQERARIAEAGLRRTLVEHTYEKRFNDIFAKIF